MIPSRIDHRPLAVAATPRRCTALCVYWPNGEHRIQNADRLTSHRIVCLERRTPDISDLFRQFVYGTNVIACPVQYGEILVDCVNEFRPVILMQFACDKRGDLANDHGDSRVVLGKAGTEHVAGFRKWYFQHMHQQASFKQSITADVGKISDMPYTCSKHVRKLKLLRVAFVPHGTLHFNLEDHVIE
jgi:hypothetical protein